MFLHTRVQTKVWCMKKNHDGIKKPLLRRWKRNGPKNLKKSPTLTSSGPHISMATNLAFQSNEHMSCTNKDWWILTTYGTIWNMISNLGKLQEINLTLKKRRKLFGIKLFIVYPFCGRMNHNVLWTGLPREIG